MEEQYLEKKINNQIRVLHMTKLGAGGISTLTIQINKCIDLNKVTFDYLVFEDEDTFYEEDVKKLGERKQIVNVGEPDNKFVLYWRKFTGTRHLLKNIHYDVVHVDASTPLDVVIGLAAKTCGVHTIVMHSHIAGDNKHSVARSIYMYICRKMMLPVFTDYFAISDAAANFMFPPKISQNHKYKIVKNGIRADLYRFDENIRDAVRHELGVTDKFVVGHVGRFSPEKNHKFLIEVFVGIVDRCPDAVLLLVGSGQTEDDIRKLVTQKGLTKNVIFYGLSHEVYNLLQAMDCFVFPSFYEGLGIAAIEAQCSGIRTYCSAGIPSETNITDLFVQFTKYDGAQWAEKIVYDRFHEIGVRTDRIKAVKKAGYDIAKVSNWLEDFYLKKAGKVG